MDLRSTLSTCAVEAPLASVQEKWVFAKLTMSRQRKYQASWEKEFAWIRKDPGGTEKAFCRACVCKLEPKKDGLVGHAKSEKHLKNTRAISQTPSLAPEVKRPRVDEGVKHAEIELAVSTACHCSIKVIDHISEVVKKHGKGSSLERIKLHRTKCSKILSEVVSPAFREELQKDMKGKKYCLFLDESTDVATVKNLVMAVRFVSSEEKKLLTSYLGVSELVGATGEDIFQAVKKEIEQSGLELSDCLGISCDGASSMVGVHNSFWTRMKEASPQCTLLRCTCHSLALCIQHAFAKLPSNLGFLLAEIPKFFCNSTIRRHEFFSLYKSMNEEECKISPFQRLCATRWLVRGKAMRSVLHNWKELKQYFVQVEKECGLEARLKAKMIASDLGNPFVHLYFVFAEPLVAEFERINQLFQGEKVDPEKVFSELDRHFRSLKARVQDHQGRALATSQVDFGAQFLAEANSYLCNHKTPDAVSKIQDVKEKCRSMLEECLEQVEKRLPENIKIFQGLSCLSPSKVLSQVEKVPFSQLPMPHLQQPVVGLIEQQYRTISFINWSEEVFGGTIPKDTVDFWLGVKSYTNTMGEKVYNDLAEYALTCLTLPVSNSTVERIFSTVTVTKTKLRNRMQVRMLDALLRIKTYLFFRGICCKTFSASPRMVELFNSQQMYNYQPEQEPLEVEDEQDSDF